jgi:hypothetical protein
LIITRNGKARAVWQNVASDEETQENLALLKVLALGHQDMATGDGRGGHPGIGQ